MSKRSASRFPRQRCLFLFGILMSSIFGTVDQLHAESPREPWTTSRIIGSPEPPLPYTVERILPSVQFQNPVDFAVEPGNGLWFILQLDGKLFCLDPSSDEAPILVHDARATIDSHDKSYGIEFHPDYVKNQYVFLSYVLPTSTPDGTFVSRFRLHRDNGSPQIDPTSEEVFLRWPCGGHNGACLKFGPDGMFYVTSGDGSGPFPPDSHDVGQNLQDLRSTIMRIDVDHPAEDKPYSIPDDNPFLDIPDARPEVWAFGFRNPWKISFDPETGELWCGDVGWELWELVFRVERGENYGWSIKEGSQPIRSDIVQGPGEIQPPIVEHPHTEARSVTGGFVYYGKELPDLTGHYIYGDYVTGKIWGITNDGDKVASLQELASSNLAIITFGIDERGELIILDYAGGIYRLKPNPQSDTSSQFPRQLSETGLYQSVSPKLVNAPGVISYSPNTQMWADGARATYQLALPGNGSIVWKQNRDRWEFPSGTVFAKTLEQFTEDNGEVRWRKIETQLLHFDGLNWNPYSYVWDEQETDAFLAPAEGSFRTINVANPESPSQRRNIEWRIHSRAECSTCHTPRAGNAVGFDFSNLASATNSPESNLEKLVELHIFDRPVPEAQRSRVMAAVDATAPLEDRARSYLAINCAHCHRREGGGTSPIELPFHLSLEKTRLIDTAPTQGTFGIAGARIIAPGHPYRSVLYYRLATVGRGHMPHLGSQLTDEEGLTMIREWISSMPSEGRTPDVSELEFTANLIKQGLNGSPEQLTPDAGELPTSKHLALADSLSSIEDVELRTRAASQWAQIAPAHIRGLYERFLAPEERVATLGTTVDPDAILALQGDPERGAELFRLSEGITCRNCHTVGMVGREVGPDLSTLGKIRSREEILASILNPSEKIDQKYALRTIETVSGKIVSGVVHSEEKDSLILKDATGTQIRVPRSEIEAMVTQPRSMMPDLLTREMTAQELIDLVDYLKSLQ